VRKPKLGLALSGGAARGWAHIGVLKAWSEAGLKPDIIAGTSMGAVAGAFMSAGRLDEIESFARQVRWNQVMNFLDVSLFGSGLIGGRRVAACLRSYLGSVKIEDLPIDFVAVATDLKSGREVWLESGDLVSAVSASYAIPGVFCPVRIGPALLVDGAFSNPMPVSTCRALGADIVIAVNVNEEKLPLDVHRSRSGPIELSADGAKPEPIADPGLPGALRDAFNIAIHRIAHARLSECSPELVVRPELNGCGYLEFHRGAELIEQGYVAGLQSVDAIRALVNRVGPRVYRDRAIDDAVQAAIA
jgi:NTE family protein